MWELSLHYQNILEDNQIVIYNKFINSKRKKQATIQTCVFTESIHNRIVIERSLTNIE